MYYVRIYMQNVLNAKYDVQPVSFRGFQTAGHRPARLASQYIFVLIFFQYFYTANVMDIYNTEWHTYNAKEEKHWF